jgi:hypothetical protein
MPKRARTANKVYKVDSYKVENAFTEAGGTVHLHHNHFGTLDTNIIYTSKGIDAPLTSKPNR